MSVPGLEAFVVRAKANTYAGSGGARPSCRPGSHDLGFDEGPWRYLDSYFGGTDFIGQEVVWRDDVPVWAMNYYGRILDSARIDAEGAGRLIKASLTALYREGRFLGGFDWQLDDLVYRDRSEGTVEAFAGREAILIGADEIYRLDYHGGLIRP